MENIDQKKPKLFGIRLSAIYETFLFLTLFWLSNFLFGDGDRMVNATYNPCWILILLVTVQYGTAEGLFAVFCSTLFLYAGNIPYQHADETTFAYQVRLGLTPALWFITAFILGELRMRLEWENKKLRSDYIHTKKEAEKITEEYQTLKETNQNLEIHLSSQEETAAASFEVFKNLTSLKPVEIIFGLDSIIILALHPAKFSVFANGPSGLEAVTSEGWSLDDTYSRRFTPTSSLYQAIALEKKMLCIVNKEDQSLLKGEGVLATPLIDPDTMEVFGMIKIEVLDFHSLNLSRIQAFRIVAELIGRAYSNAKKHQKEIRK